MYATKHTTPRLGQEVLISINERITTWGVTYNSLCCYAPRKHQDRIKQFLSSSHPVSMLDKEKKLTPIFVNNITKTVALQLKEELKLFLKKAGLPFKEHKGRVKDEAKNTCTNHESPINAKNTGYIGHIRPWKTPYKDVLTLNKTIVKNIPNDKLKTSGELTEERLLNTLLTLKDRNVDIFLSNRGSHLDVIGKDLIIHYQKQVWGFQIKCSALDAYLQAEKYPQEICLWVNPNSSDKEIQELCQTIKELTWGIKAPKNKSLERAKPQLAR